MLNNDKKIYLVLFDNVTGAEILKDVGYGEYDHFERIAEGVVRGWARRLVRKEWIKEGKLIDVKDGLRLTGGFAKGMTAEILKKEVLERAKWIYWSRIEKE